MSNLNLQALVFNCTLKPSPKQSNTRGLIDQVAGEYTGLGIETEVVRPVDYSVAPGTQADMGDGDEWPELLEKVRQCDIFLLASPVWMGGESSVVQRVIERLDAIFHDKELQDPATGQYLMYNKVGGAIVTGNEDGAKNTISRLIWVLSNLGCVIPPNSSTYWVGKAGPGPSYRKADGKKHQFSNTQALYLAHNTAEFARRLKDDSVATNLNELTKKAKQMSEKEA